MQLKAQGNTRVLVNVGCVWWVTLVCLAITGFAQHDAWTMDGKPNDGFSPGRQVQSSVQGPSTGVVKVGFLHSAAATGHCVSSRRCCRPRQRLRRTFTCACTGLASDCGGEGHAVLAFGHSSGGHDVPHHRRELCCCSESSLQRSSKVSPAWNYLIRQTPEALSVKTVK